MSSIFARVSMAKIQPLYIYTVSYSTRGLRLNLGEPRLDALVRRKDHPMPETAAFVQWLRDAFGDATINEAVRRGKAGEPSFYACENSRAVGTASPPAVIWQVDDSIRTGFSIHPAGNLFSTLFVFRTGRTHGYRKHRKIPAGNPVR